MDIVTTPPTSTNAPFAQTPPIVPTPYERALDPFGFSHGEGTVATSDAEQCDYGFSGLITPSLAPGHISGFSGGVDANATSDDGTRSINTTPEVITNDYGATWGPGPGDPGPGDQSIKSTTRGLPLHKPSPTGGLLRAQTGKQASGGATGHKHTAIQEGTPDIIGTYKQTFPTVGSTAPSVSGTASQMKDATTTQTYVGQLATANAAKGGAGLSGMSPGMLVAIGGGLLILGLLLKA